MSVTVLEAADSFRLTRLEAVLDEIVLGDRLLFAESLIDQASDEVASFLGLVLAQQRYREVQPVMDRHEACLILRHRPIARIDSLNYLGTDLLAEDYRIDAEKGLVYLHPSEGHHWFTSWGTGWWGWWPEWRMDYVAGYVLPEQSNAMEPLGPYLPGKYERACIEAVKVWFHERLVGERIEGRTLGDQRIDYGVQARRTGLPVLSKDILAVTRKLWLA